MLDDDSILNASVLYSKEEVLAEFWESCEAEAEAPGRHQERLEHAAKDLCQMLDRQSGL